MSDDRSRRTFMKWLGVGAGAAVGGLAGCSDVRTPGGGDARSRDARGGDTADGGDTRRARDTSRGADTVAPDTGAGDTGAGDTRGDTRGGDTGVDTQDGTDGGPDADTADGGGTDADAASCEATGEDVEGPFFAEGAPERKNLAPSDEPGQRILIHGTVYQPDCRTPEPGAIIDVWHANEQGDYYDASDDYRLRGQLETASDGSYTIRTIKPGSYRTAGGLRPAHVHFTISSPKYGPLTTQMYFAGDPKLAPNDPCGGCSSGDPTLIVDFSMERRNGEELLVGQFDIVLGGA